MMQQNSKEKQDGRRLGPPTQDQDQEDYLDYVPDEKDELDTGLSRTGRKNQRLAGLTGPKEIIEEAQLGGPAEDPLEGHGRQRIADREDEYHQRRQHRCLSPERQDAFEAPARPAKSAQGQPAVGAKRAYKDTVLD